MSQSQCLSALCQGLLRVPQVPQGMGSETEAENSRIEPEQGGIGPVLLGIIQGQTLVQVLPGRGKLSQEETGTSQCPMRPDEIEWVVD